MTTLQDIFGLLGYDEISEQFALIKLIAYQGGFNRPDYYLSEEKNKETPHYKRRSLLAIENNTIWHQTQFYPYYENHKDKIISDEEVAELLKIKLHPSLLLSFIWFANTMQIYFLRKEFELEGIRNEHLNINQARFEQKDEIATIVLKKEEKQQSTRQQLFQLAESLHFIEEHPWPKNQTFHHVILQSVLEKYLKERMDFLQPFTGNLYLFTSPRGVFNFEKTLATILAEWFDMPNKIGAIWEFLQAHSNNEDPLQWHKNLSALKKALVNELNAKEWPKAPKSFYYYPGHKEIYDAAAHEAKHEPLDCEGGPWPVAPDIAYRFLQNRFKNDSEAFKKINFVPIVSQGKNGRLASTEDLLEIWLKQYGNTLAEEGSPVLIIGCNNLHFIPFLKYVLTQNKNYQDVICKSHLKNKLEYFNTIHEIKEKEMALAKGPQWYLAGPAAHFFSSSLLFDSLAKSIFTVRQKIEKIVPYYQYVKENIFQCHQSQVLDITLARRMTFYHQQKELLYLANATIDLAFIFYFQGNLIKTAGLFNFAMNVLDKIEDTSIKKLIKLIYQSSLVNMQHFIKMVTKDLSSSERHVDINLLQSIDNQNRSRLDSIRLYILKKFSHISPDNTEEIRAIYQCIFQKMQAFYLSIADQAEQLLEKKVTEIAHVFMGSYSRLQQTPFSDIESCIIVRDDANFKFAMSLTKTILMQILQLRETLLWSLGITFNISGHLFTFDKIYDNDYTLYGFSYDSRTPPASKTPLGKKNYLGVVYRLIGTPLQLVARFSSLYGYHLDPYLPQLIHFTRFGGGDVGLYNAFTRFLKKYSQINFSMYSLVLLTKDLKKNIFSLEEMKLCKAVNHKNYFFRPVNDFLDDLFIALGPVKNVDSHEKIDHLFYANLIDDQQRKQLIYILNIVLYLRLHQHFKVKAQRFNIAPTDPMFLCLYQSQQVMKSILTNISDRLQQNETRLLKKAYQLSKNYQVGIFKLPPANKQFIQTKEMKWSIRSKL